MQRWAKYIVIAGVSILIIPVVVFVIFFSTGGIYKCSDTPSITMTSANNKLIASVYIRDCGASTSSSTHVSITDKKTFSSDERDDVLIIDGKRTIQLAWDGNTLNILLDSDIDAREIYLRRSMWNSTRVNLIRISGGYISFW